MKQKYKTFSQAGLWTASLFIFQIIGLIAAIVVKVKTDPVFTNELYNTLTELLAYSDAGDYVGYYANLGSTYFALMGELVNLCFIFLVIPYIILMYVNTKKNKVNPVKSISSENVFKLVVIGLSLNLVISFILNTILPFLPADMVASLTSSTGTATAGNMFLTVLATGIIGPVIEEITFRYGCQRTLKKGFSVKTAIIIQAILFGVVHGNVIQAAYATVLGLVFGYIYEKSNENLLTSCICHASVNTSSVIIASLGVNEYSGLIVAIFAYVAILYIAKKLINNTQVAVA